MITDNKRKKNSEPTGLSKIQALRREALSVLFAKEAAEDREVKDFREVVLGDKLLRWDEVPGWIKKQARKEKRESRLTHWLTIPVSSEDFDTDVKGALTFRPPLKLREIEPSVGYGLSVKTLAYVGPKDRSTLREPTSPGGNLEKLKNLSESLAKSFCWQEAQATVFVLTGITPQVSTQMVARQINPSAANRIVLTLDPALTDKEVAAVYRKARRRLLKKDKQGKARFRLQSEKHLRLAIFDAEHEGTYLKKMNVWNKQFPKWEYEHLSNFIRDCKKAKERLLKPDYYDWEEFFNV